MPNSGIAPSAEMKKVLNHLFALPQIFTSVGTSIGDVLEDRIFSFNISTLDA